MSRRRKRHSPEQIVRMLRDADAMLAGGKTIGEVCQALEIAEATFHRWRNQYGGMKAEEAKRDIKGDIKGTFYFLWIRGENRHEKGTSLIME